MCENNDYTRDELTLKCGLQALAAAVIRQWQLDGKPEKDMEFIHIWKDIALMEGHDEN